ncbi:hypothetical protein PV350_04835 [Streptomyces sp. PA03-6a]|nr:hypothetical protein [Streptomyces sp. PA03-6a]
MTALGLFFTGVIVFAVAVFGGQRPAPFMAGFGLGLCGLAYVLVVVQLIGWGISG